MIFICVKFTVKPDWADRWLDTVDSFTQATRAEPGNKWFEWSRSVDDPNVFVLVEAFDDDGAVPHVQSDHFQQAMVDLKPALAKTPDIFNTQVEQDGWSEMGELKID